jgi:hypothetical protein
MGLLLPRTFRRRPNPHLAGSFLSDCTLNDVRRFKCVVNVRCVRCPGVLSAISDAQRVFVSSSGSLSWPPSFLKHNLKLFGDCKHGIEAHLPWQYLSRPACAMLSNEFSRALTVRVSSPSPTVLLSVHVVPFPALLHQNHTTVDSQFTLNGD